MTDTTPRHSVFVQLTLFNWLLEKLKAAALLRMTVLHSADGADLSLFCLAANIDVIAIHGLDLKSINPASAFFSRFSKSLWRSSQTRSPVDVAEIAQMKALHVLANPFFEPKPQLFGIHILAPQLAEVRATARLPNGRDIQIGEEVICSISRMTDVSLARFKDLTGAQDDGETLVLAVPDVLAEHSIIVVRADRLVHDGAYGAESNGDHCWLWSGPDPHFRLMVGSLPFRPARLSVVVAGEGVSGNLESARVFINGRLEHAQVESWGGGAGRLSVQVDETVSDPVVFSFGARSMFEAGGRQLGMSIAQLEVGVAR